MPIKRKRRQHNIRIHWPTKGQCIHCIAMVVTIGLCITILRLGVLLKDLSSEMALNDARDAAVNTVNEAVILMMTRGNYDYDYFVDLCTGSDGQVTSLNANMSRVNAFSSALLDYVGQLDRKKLEIHIPLGNLTGSSLLLGRGPDVVVHMIMLTSPHIEFRSALDAAGINQTEHRLFLDVVVDIDVLVPWGTISTQAVTQVLIAQTVIVGRVPNLYVNTTE